MQRVLGVTSAVMRAFDGAHAVVSTATSSRSQRSSLPARSLNKHRPVTKWNARFHVRRRGGRRVNAARIVRLKNMRRTIARNDDPPVASAFWPCPQNEDETRHDKNRTKKYAPISRSIARGLSRASWHD